MWHRGDGAMDQGYAVGIDLGTSNTVAIVRWPDGRTRPVLFDGQPVLPSAVFLDHTGTLQVGRDATRLAQLDPARYEPNPKRRIDEDALLLGDRELPIADVLAAPLRAIARSVRDTIGHLPPAVLTCPAAWGTTRRTRLQDAAGRAGWPPVRLVAEPIAAARYFTETLKRPVPPGATLAIFDFGGGTLDVALVRNDGATFTVTASGGAEDLGGLDIDSAIVTHLGGILAVQHPQVWEQIERPTDELARRNRRTFWDDVRAAKEMLSRTTSAPIAVPGVSASIHLTRDELEQLATPLLRRATGHLTAALRQAGLSAGNLSGIFLVGGTSRVPLVSRLLHTETGIAPTVLEQPELPVAEGAVAGSPPTGGGSTTSTPVSAPPGVPISGMPISGSPIASVSAAPAVAPIGPGLAPVSLGATPVGAFTNTAAPPVVPAPIWPVPPRAMPPGAMPPGYAVAPPPMRPPRRYRAWPWLLSILLVIGLICGGGYLLFRPDPPGDPLSGKRTITIAGLAPAGYRQSIVTDKKAYAIGQHTDGRVEVVTVDLATGAEVRHQSEPAGGWAGARLVGDWVIVFSTPAADGSRRVALSNGVDDKNTTVTLGKDEDLTFPGVDTATNDLGYLLYSPGTGTVRAGLIGGPTPTSSRQVALPRGARLMSDLRLQQDEIVFVDPAGQIYTYNGGVSLDQPSSRRAPPGHPPTLVHYSASDSTLYVAEDKLEYQVLRDGAPIYRGPADRQPMWIGACGSRQDRTCVVDQRPNDPASREILAVTDSGNSQSTRGAAAHADVPGWVLGATSSLYDVLIVPTKEGEAIGTAIVALGGKSRSYPGELWLLDGANGILIPTRPAGAAADWAATPQQVEFKGVSLAGDRVRSIGTQTVRPGSCYAGAGRLACAGADDYSVWSVVT
jgi:actin-like ATPase involved in cell morphogenesis